MQGWEGMWANYAKAQMDQFVRDTEFRMRAQPVMLYDQFGRPVYVPSTAPKIGKTVRVQRPLNFNDR